MCGKTELEKIAEVNKQMLLKLAAFKPLKNSVMFLDETCKPVASIFIYSHENASNNFDGCKLSVHEAYTKMLASKDVAQPIGKFRFQKEFKNQYSVSVNGGGYKRYYPEMDCPGEEAPTKRQYRGNIQTGVDLQNFINHNSMKYFVMQEALGESIDIMADTVVQYSITNPFQSAK